MFLAKVQFDFCVIAFFAKIRNKNGFNDATFWHKSLNVVHLENNKFGAVFKIKPHIWEKFVDARDPADPFNYAA